MKMGFFFIGFFCLLSVFFIFQHQPDVRADSLFEAYDVINTSAPASSTNHLLRFVTARAVPAGGKIVISFAANSLNIPAAFNYQDVDLETATSGINVFSQRVLGSTPATSTDGVAVTSGLGGKITINLSSSAGIGAHNRIRIKMGTNASFGGNGTSYIINATAPGAYKINIQTTDAAGAVIDKVQTLVVMIEPVSVSSGIPKIRSNGKPDGTLSALTVTTIMSLTTNYSATCRYSNASGTLYSLIPNDFYTTDGIYHTVVLTGLLSTHCYNYYVRCHDTSDGSDDTTDYLIHFCIAAVGEGGTGGGTGGGSGSGSGTGTGAGGGGGGGGGNFKPYPILPHNLPGLALSGWAYPGALVTVLKDGKKVVNTTSSGDAKFILTVSDLTKGLYTFSLIAQDTDKISSIAYPTTFWIDENTQTNVENIILPPTIKLGSANVPIGEDIIVSGQSIPKQLVSIEFNSPEGKLVEKKVEKVQADGRWQTIFKTNGLTKGVYDLTAQTTHSTVGTSVKSERLKCGVGQKIEEGGPCARSDLNKDGKVNLVDFSILMFNWGTANANADINQDGKINLVDFSILMYCWTG